MGSRSPSEKPRAMVALKASRRRQGILNSLLHLLVGAVTLTTQFSQLQTLFGEGPPPFILTRPSTSTWHLQRRVSILLTNSTCSPYKPSTHLSSAQ